MSEKTIAQEIGVRIRRFRQLKNWSQKDLGEKICTTSAAISKYEKEGVSNIEVILELSKALEVDLLKDEMDEEGEVGEIGLEILSMMVSRKYNFDDDDPSYFEGNIDAEDVLDGDRLYGLGKERIIHELAKLENFGLCVREQFTDYDGENHDIIFITAKGLIVLKRMKPDIEFPERVKSYEMQCNNCSCVQEYIDSNNLHKAIEQMKIESAFRYNFFAYISRLLWRRDFSENKELYGDIFIGISCYADIIYSMMLKLNRQDADRLAIGEIRFDEEIELEKYSTSEDDYLDYLSCWPEHLRDMVEDQFIDYMKKNVNEKYYIPASKKENEKMRRKLSEEEKRLKEAVAPKKKEQSEFFEKYDLRVEELKSDGKKTDPRKLFNKDEIINWVKNNVLPPANEDEKEKQNLMEEWLEKYYNARAYFRFPKEWEENGIAETVREAFGISEIMKKHMGETYDDNNDDIYTFGYGLEV